MCSVSLKRGDRARIFCSAAQLLFENVSVSTEKITFQDSEGHERSRGGAFFDTDLRK